MPNPTDINVSNDTINVSSGWDTNISGNNDTADLAAGSTGAVIGMSGSGDLIQVDGGSNDTLDASGVAIILSGTNTNDVVDGSGNTIDVSASGDNFGASDDTIVLSANTATDVTGTGDTFTSVPGALNVDLTASGEGADISLTADSGSALVLNGSSSDTVNAIGDGITLNGGNSNTDINGGGDAVHVTGGANSFSATGEMVALAAGTNTTIDGNDNFINAAPGANNVSVSVNGGSDAVGLSDASGDVVGGNQITVDIGSDVTGLSLGASDDTVNVNGSGNSISAENATVNLASGTQNGDISGVGNVVKAVSGAIGVSIGLSGACDSVAINGDSGSTVILEGGNVAAVTATGDTVVLGSNNTNVSLNGGGDTIEVDGGGNSVMASDETVVLGGNSGLALNGNNDSITTAVGASDVSVSYSGAGDTVTLAAGSGDIVAASGAAVTVTSGVGDATLAGSGNRVTVTGVGNALNASGDSIVFDAGAQALVSGNGDSISANSGAVGVDLTIAGTGNTITLDGGSNDSITADGQTIVLDNTNVNENLVGVGNTIYVNNTGDVMDASESDIILAANTSTTFDSAGNVIQGTNDDQITDRNGTGNSINLLAYSVPGNTTSSVTLAGTSGDTVTSAGNAIVLEGPNLGLNIVGGANTVAVDGSGNSLVASGDTFTMVSGSGDVLTLVGGTSNTVNAGGDVLVLQGTQSGATTITGGGNTVEVDASGDDLVESGDAIVLAVGTSTTIAGNDDTIGPSYEGIFAVTPGHGVSVAVSGDDDTLTLAAESDSVAVLANTSGTVIDTPGGEVVGGNGTVTLAGGDTRTVINGGSAMVDVVGSGDDVTTENGGDGFNLAANSVGTTITTEYAVSPEGGAIEFDSVSLGDNAQVAVNGNGAIDVSSVISGGVVTLAGSTFGGIDTTGDSINLLNVGFGTEVNGSGNKIEIAAPGSVSEIAGNDNAVTISGTGAEVTLSSGAGNTLADGGSGNQISLLGGDTGALISASGDTIVLGSAVVGLVIGGTGNTIEVRGTGDSFTDPGDTVMLAAGTSTQISAVGDSIGADAGAVGTDLELWGTGNGVSLNADSGSTVEIQSAGSYNVCGMSGATDTAVINADDAESYVLGDGAQVQVMANDDVVIASNSYITLAAGERATLLGSGNRVLLNGGDILAVDGSNNAVTDPGTGNQVVFAGGTGNTASSDIAAQACAQPAAVVLPGEGPVSINSTGVVDVLGGGAVLNITAGGSGDSVYASDAVINVPAGDTAFVTGNGNQINLTGANAQAFAYGSNNAVSGQATQDYAFFSDGAGNTATGTATASYGSGVTAAADTQVAVATSALAADLVYGLPASGSAIPDSLGPNWILVATSGADGNANFSDPSLAALTPEADGYVGAAWYNPSSGEMIFSNRGSVFSNGGTYWSDLGISLNNSYPQETSAAQFAFQVLQHMNSGANPQIISAIYTTGHSMGGTTAQYQAGYLAALQRADPNVDDGLGSITGKFSITNITFNAPGIGATVDAGFNGLQGNYSSYNLTAAMDVVSSYGGEDLSGTVSAPLAFGPQIPSELASALITTPEGGVALAAIALGDALDAHEMDPMYQALGQSALGNMPVSALCGLSVQQMQNLAGVSQQLYSEMDPAAQQALLSGVPVAPPALVYADGAINGAPVGFDQYGYDSGGFNIIGRSAGGALDPNIALNGGEAISDTIAGTQVAVEIAADGSYVLTATGSDGTTDVMSVNASGQLTGQTVSTSGQVQTFVAGPVAGEGTVDEYSGGALTGSVVTVVNPGGSASVTQTNYTSGVAENQTVTDLNPNGQVVGVQYSGTGGVVNVDNATVTVASGAQVTLMGANDTISGSGGEMDLAGTNGDTIDSLVTLPAGGGQGIHIVTEAGTINQNLVIGGPGNGVVCNGEDSIELAGSNGSIAMGDHSVVDVGGFNNSVALPDTATLGPPGASLTLNGAGGTAVSAQNANGAEIVPVLVENSSGTTIKGVDQITLVDDSNVTVTGVQNGGAAESGSRITSLGSNGVTVAGDGMLVNSTNDQNFGVSGTNNSVVLNNDSNSGISGYNGIDNGTNWTVVGSTNTAIDVSSSLENASSLVLVNDAATTIQGSPIDVSGYSQDGSSPTIGPSTQGINVSILDGSAVPTSAEAAAQVYQSMVSDFSTASDLESLVSEYPGMADASTQTGTGNADANLVGGTATNDQYQLAAPAVSGVPGTEPSSIPWAWAAITNSAGAQQAGIAAYNAWELGLGSQGIEESALLAATIYGGTNNSADVSSVLASSDSGYVSSYLALAMDAQSNSSDYSGLTLFSSDSTSQLQALGGEINQTLSDINLLGDSNLGSYLLADTGSASGSGGSLAGFAASDAAAAAAAAAGAAGAGAAAAGSDAAAGEAADYGAYVASQEAGYGGGGGSQGSGYSGGDGSQGGQGLAWVPGTAGGTSALNIVASEELALGNFNGAVAAQAAYDQALQLAAQAPSGGSGAAVDEGLKWSQPTVTWSLAPQNAGGLVTGALDPAEQVLAQQAFNTWAADAPGLTFLEVSGPSDICIGLGNFGTATTGVLGYTSAKSDGLGDLTQAQITVENPSEDPLAVDANGRSLYSGTAASFEQVLLHEIGHAIGFADNSDSSSIMYYELNGQNQGLSATDAGGAAALYSPAHAAAERLVQAMAGMGVASAMAAPLAPNGLDVHAVFLARPTA